MCSTKSYTSIRLPSVRCSTSRESIIVRVLCNLKVRRNKRGNCNKKFNPIEREKSKRIACNCVKWKSNVHLGLFYTTSFFYTILFARFLFYTILFTRFLFLNTFSFSKLFLNASTVPFLRPRLHLGPFFCSHLYGFFRTPLLTIFRTRLIHIYTFYSRLHGFLFNTLPSHLHFSFLSRVSLRFTYILILFLEFAGNFT